MENNIELLNIFIHGNRCSLFAAEKANLILTARRVDRLEALQNEIKLNFPDVLVHIASLDVAKRDQVFKTVAELPASFKNIDILVNNAGNEIFCFIRPHYYFSKYDGKTIKIHTPFFFFRNGCWHGSFIGRPAGARRCHD